MPLSSASQSLANFPLQMIITALHYSPQLVALSCYKWISRCLLSSFTVWNQCRPLCFYNSPELLGCWQVLLRMDSNILDLQSESVTHPYSTCYSSISLPDLQRKHVSWPQLGRPGCLAQAAAALAVARLSSYLCHCQSGSRPGVNLTRGWRRGSLFWHLHISAVG